MRLNYEFGFLAKECPLVSRELVKPWRLAALAVGLGILIAGSHLTPSADWDYPICFVMGLWAYVFAPWTVRALVYLDWKRLPLAWLFAWAGIDGVYSLYWWLRGFDALQVFRGPNIAYSAPLYFIFGLAMNLRLVRCDAPQDIRGALADSVRTLHDEFSITKESLNDAYADLQGNPNLKVVDYRTKDSQEVEKQYYIVKKGDTLSSIAVENNTTVTLLCKLNKMKKTDVLRAGRRLRVK